MKGVRKIGRGSEMGEMLKKDKKSKEWWKENDELQESGKRDGDRN